MILIRRCGLVLAFSTVLGAQNLIPDGGFENGTFAFSCTSQATLVSTWFPTGGTGADCWTTNCAQKPALSTAYHGHFTTLPAHGGFRFTAGWGQYAEAFGTTLSALLTPGAAYRVGGFFTKSPTITGAQGFTVWLSPNQTITGAQLGVVGTNAVAGTWVCDSFQFTAPAQPGTRLIFVPIAGYTGADDLYLVPASGPLYQVNQPGVAAGSVNGAAGTAYCPATTVVSLASGPPVTISLAGASYDVAYSLGEAFPAWGPPAIGLPDGQSFNLNLATVSWLCPGGPTPCLSGSLTLPFSPPFAGLVVTAQVVAFGVGPLGVSLSQPFTLKVAP
jgi:hypothetical protein